MVMTMARVLAVDIGGTFTDLVVVDETGHAFTKKVLSTPPNLVKGVLYSLTQANTPLEDVVVFVHGTTAGLNAVLERRGARVAVVTTRGFRDVYFIGRGHRPDMYNLHYRKPLPLVRREDVFEIGERLNARGEIIEPLDEQSLREVTTILTEKNFDAVAVCFLHSYINASHEIRAQEILEELLPNVAVLRSSQVAPEWREYERTSTTVASAYITPIMRSYVGELEKELAERGLTVPVYIVESNGGVMAAHLAKNHAVRTLFSGPVGGVVGARAVSMSLGYSNVISADVGGTSFDVSLLYGGKLSLQQEFDIAGLPVLAPAVEVHTIGAGGGSIISVERSGRLRVGPESAGAVPGPACYGRGGDMPTVTDAHVILGHLPASHALAGSVELDVSAARAAMAQTAEQLGLGPELLAEQALEIINFRMAEAIRELTVERGIDPRTFTLCAFGGAGGLHAAALAEELEIDRIVVPALPGSFSAWGMLHSGIRHDVVRSFFCPVYEASASVIGAISALVEEVSKLLEDEGIPRSEFFVEVSADLRYVGQEYSLTIPIALPVNLENIVSSFHEAYHRRYGHSTPTEGVEFVALRVAGVAELPLKPRFEVPQGEGGSPVGSTSVWKNGMERMIPVWRREDLGRTIEGPCLVVEYTSTTLVPENWNVRVSDGGSLVLERLGSGV